jgi:hypothetical protein
VKYTADRPFADPEKAARKLLEIANTVEAVQDGRIHIEKINGALSARGIMDVCHSGTNITAGRVARHLFPQTILDADGQPVTTRPINYDPPPGWTPPA